MLNSPNFRSCGDSQEKGIGTGFGNKADHRVTAVEFERASTAPAKIITIRYAERNELVAIGVDLGIKATVASANPFPAEVGCERIVNNIKSWESLIAAPFLINENFILGII